MSKKFKIVMSSSSSVAPPQQLIEGMKAHLPEEFDLVLPVEWSEEGLLRVVSDADAIFGGRISRRIIESAPRLKLIQVTGTGVDGVDLEAAAKRGVTVCNMVGFNAIWIAEHAVALILALAKNITKYHRDLKQGIWNRIPSVDIENKTVGIVGFGSIGREITKRLKAFDARIIGVKKHPSEELKKQLGIDFLGGAEDLDYVIKESDFLILSMVLTPETRKMIGERELSLMKRTAYLINIARGEVVDEQALIKALRDGGIAGAGIDVFEKEPTDPDSLLLTMDNVVATPHVGGRIHSSDAFERRVRFAVRNITKALTGGTPDNIADPILGYARRTYWEKY